MSIFDDPIFPGKEYRDSLGGYDSELWLELFVQADKINENLCQCLMYLRNTGCRLNPSEKFGYVILPIEDYWVDVSYEEEKKCLNPYRDDVIRLLRGLRK